MKTDSEQATERTAHKIDIDTPDPGYGPFPVSIMNRCTHEVMTFDPSLGKPAVISYRLNKPGCIRIRLVHRDQPNLVIRTLQDWTNQGFGKHELTWDGRDASGNIVDNKKIFVLFEAQDQGKGRQHQGHDEEICRDPLLMIKTRTDPFQIVRGSFEMETSLVTMDGFGEQAGCEIRYSIDYKLIETKRFEKGIKTFGFRIDTTSFNNGEHLITVNVDDFHDHIGSGGVKINVEN
jgi:hypothetical protein